MTLDVLNVIQLGCERVLDVDDDDLPIGLAFVEEGHDAEDFDLFDLPDVTHLFADLAYVQWIVVAPGLGLGMLLIRILPSLQFLRVSVLFFFEGRWEAVGGASNEGSGERVS
jgi:hypothetical protein